MHPGAVWASTRQTLTNTNYVKYLLHYMSEQQMKKFLQVASKIRGLREQDVAIYTINSIGFPPSRYTIQCLKFSSLTHFFKFQNQSTLQSGSQYPCWATLPLCIRRIRLPEAAFAWEKRLLQCSLWVPRGLQAADTHRDLATCLRLSAHWGLRIAHVWKSSRDSWIFPSRRNINAAKRRKTQ